eukprot:Partr_v1_DN28093_c0_g1_i2_m57461 putative Bacterial low temperature requirement A protein (LtrA)
MPQTHEAPSIPDSSPALSKKEHFAQEEFGPVKKVRFLESYLYDDPVFRQTFAVYSRPRQFWKGDVLYREKSAHKVSWDELFLDLLFVSIFTSLGLQIKSHPHNLTFMIINDYFLTFVPAYMAWSEITEYLNKFGRNDTFHRLWLYIQMALAFGMSLNAENCFNPKNHDPDIFETTDSTKNTASIYIGTFLVLRIVQVVTYLVETWRFPEFGKSIIFSSVMPVLGCIFWAMSMNHNGDLGFLRAMWWTGYLVTTAIQFASAVVNYARPQMFEYRISVNIEHWVERRGLLMIIVLGELVVSILWPSTEPEFSIGYVNTILGLVIAVCLEWLYFYLLDGYGGHFVHPYRRNHFYSFVWDHIHLTVSASLVMAGTAAGILIRYDPDQASKPTQLTDHYGVDSTRWYLCGGLASAIVQLTIMGLLYKTRTDQKTRELEQKYRRRMSGIKIRTLPIRPVPDEKRVAFAVRDSLPPSIAGTIPSNLPPKHLLVPRFAKWIRLCIRMSVAVILLLVAAFGQNLDVSHILAITAGAMFGGVFLEEFGKMRVLLPETVDEDEEVEEEAGIESNIAETGPDVDNISGNGSDGTDDHHSDFDRLESGTSFRGHGNNDDHDD